MPDLDVPSGPELATPSSEVDHWAGHVGVTALIERDCVALRETEQLGNTLSINDIVGVNHPSHRDFEPTTVDKTGPTR